MTWDPDRYLRFADHRSRPGFELMARIPGVSPLRVFDLGCGTGNLTAALAERWPSANVFGIDSSPEMIERARTDHPHLTWTVADLSEWGPDDAIDVIYSNATLHWLDDHASLFGRLRSWLAEGGVLAVQMPDNWQAPTHRIPAEVLDEGGWSESARLSLMRDRLAAPPAYARWVQPASVDMWRTTYHQQLTGDDPVWTWVTGSVLRPVLASLEGAERDAFEAMCRDRYRDAYPPDDDGITTLEFSRLFIIATAV